MRIIKMNNSELQAYTEYKERRDQLVRRFCSLSSKLEDYDLRRMPSDSSDSVDGIFAIIMRQVDGPLHEYPQNIEGIKKANVTLAQDIERLEYIYQQIDM